MTDYALWEVILNGDSPPQTRSVKGVETSYPPTTVEEKLARKNELKARGTLLMALPIEHQLKFNSYKNAKSLMEAIEKRFGGNKESKKVLKILLKQQYKNFNGTSLEGLNQIYDQLQKLINLETLSMDDLYNNLKIYKVEVMRSSSTTQNTQNIAFVSSNNTDSTNKAVNTAHGVSATNSKTNASNLPNVDSLSDAMAMLTMRARRFLLKTGSNLGVKGTETIGFDKTNVECYNCHRRGHFAKECRASKHQDNRNMEASRRTVPVEETTSNVLVSQCDRLIYDWSDQDEYGPTYFARMAHTSSSSSSSSNSDTKVSICSKACLKSYETLKEHYDNLTKDFNKSQFNLGAYKAGLECVKARLEVYKKNETVFTDNIKILKLNVMLTDKAITELRKKFEKAKKERDDLKLALEKFQDLSKNLSRLLDSQQSEGYHAVPPPYTGNFMPFKPDLMFADEHIVSESVTSLPAITKSEIKTSETTLKNVSAPIIED
nr:ribonuclease H-like domain-containing protein [Tanacetum cinerariifolium]